VIEPADAEAMESITTTYSPSSWHASSRAASAPPS
jgi:hypothetical protein